MAHVGEINLPLILYISNYRGHIVLTFFFEIHPLRKLLQLAIDESGNHFFFNMDLQTEMVIAQSSLSRSILARWEVMGIP